MNTESSPAYQGRVKYTETNARKYQGVKERKNRAELNLVTRAFALIPKGRVLDAPCGGGRVSQLLAGKGYQMRAADLSEPMRLIAQENFTKAGLEIQVDAEDLEKLSYADGSFDAVICFRLFHHFPNPEIRQRVVSELCRVAWRYVALSYFSPYSVTSLQRRWRVARGGRKSQKFSTTLDEVEGYFHEAGFRLVGDFARLPLIHTLHLGVFQRDAD